MTELNELFEQIFHCEKNFKEKIDQLKALDTSIQECQLKLEQTGEELLTMQGKLAVKDSKLADIEMEVKLMQLRKEILRNQKNELLNDTNNLSDELGTAERESTSKKKSFLEQLSKFSHRYSLHDQGLNYREETTKKQIDVLQEELILMETEMIEIESCIEDVKFFEQELSKAEDEFKQEKERQQALRTRQLEQEVGMKTDNSKEMSNNSDLKHLQSELDSCKNSREEETCRKLRAELEELQRERYHKQMRLQVARHSQKTNYPKAKRRETLHFPDHTDVMQVEEKLSRNRDWAIHDWSDEDSLTNESVGNIIDDEWLNPMEEDVKSDEEDGSEESGWDDIDETELELLEQNLVQTNKQYSEGEAEKSNWNSTISQSRNNSEHGQTLSRVLSVDFRTAHGLPGKSEKNQIKEKPGEKFSSLHEPRFKRSSYPVMKATSYCIDSPDSSLVPRKRPGESILKAHGCSDHQTTSSTKKAKKVQFHY